MKRKYLVLVLNIHEPNIDWLGEYDTKAEAQTQLDRYMAEQAKGDEPAEAGWVVETVGRNYLNT